MWDEKKITHIFFYASIITFINLEMVSKSGVKPMGIICDYDTMMVMDGCKREVIGEIMRHRKYAMVEVDSAEIKKERNHTGGIFGDWIVFTAWGSGRRRRISHLENAGIILIWHGAELVKKMTFLLLGCGKL